MSAGIGSNPGREGGGLRSQLRTNKDFWVSLRLDHEDGEGVVMCECDETGTILVGDTLINGHPNKLLGK